MSEIEQERRKMTLTEADLEALRDSLSCHTCKFSTDQAQVLQSIADNVSTTQKVATKFIIYGMVAAVFGGIWFAIKHLAVEIIHTGQVPGK